MRESGPDGIAKRDLPNGARFIQVHYHADEGKRDPAWAEQASRGFPRKEWLREMELDDSQYDGEAVHPSFDSAVHVSQTSLPLVPGSDYIAGWDCGSAGLDLAFCLAQITPHPIRQIQLLCEVVPKGKEPAEMFFQRVESFLSRKYPSIKAQIFHEGDPTGGNRSPVGPPAFDIAARYGLHINPSHNQLHARLSAVDWALEDDINPKFKRFIISKKDCPILTEGLAGAYEWKIKGGSRGTFNPGTETMQPAKNSYSHVNDALQYLMLRAKLLITGMNGTTRTVNRARR